MAHKVPSPMWQALNDLYNDVNKNLGTVAGALSDADKMMAGGNGDVWVGSTARTWGSQLSGASGDLSKQANGFLDYVRTELSKHPKKVTQAEATLENRFLAGRMG